MMTITRRFFLVALFASSILLMGGCASTQYGRVDLSRLSNDQLIQELASAERELGIQTDYRTALLAIDTSPRPVVTSATTTYSGNFNAQYNSANRMLYGSFNGSGYTTYQSIDANAGARFGQTIALIVNASNANKLENRRKAVLIEISHRQNVRANIERITGQFLLAHPDIAANRDLLIGCLLITQHQTADPLEQLQTAGEMMNSLPKNRWIGWVEAHGIPNHPYGVVVGTYSIDTSWNGDVLTGEGKASDGSEMNLTAHRTQDGLLEGTIQSQTMEAKFFGRMTDTALCVDYKGKEGDQLIRGITWAYRRVETNDLRSSSISVARTQTAIFSGHYTGNGKTTSNGVEQPYRIVLDIFDSGKIAFTCLATINDKEVIVTGTGSVDAAGNITVQNEFGDVGHGTISGNILKAGGESSDGSVRSLFTASKQ